MIVIKAYMVNRPVQRVKVKSQLGIDVLSTWLRNCVVRTGFQWSVCDKNVRFPRAASGLISFKCHSVSNLD